MGRDGQVERNGLGDTFSWDARRGPPMGDQGPQPPARFWHFSAVKSAPPEAVPDCRRLSACGKRSKPCPRLPALPEHLRQTQQAATPP